MAARKAKAARRKAAKRAPARAKTPRTTNAAARSGAGAQPDRRTSKTETLRLRSVEPIFTVSDLERSIRFYTDVLGFVVGDRYSGDTGVLQGVMLKAGVCQLGLSQDDWAKGRDRQRGTAVRIWCTTVQDIDRLAARVRAAGHQLAEGPTDQPWGGRSFGVDDPDGFHLTIYRPAESTPPPERARRAR
jgi:catechol 2,3-dioxygenase-like lactoylglutathione lyase family enzyme